MPYALSAAGHALNDSALRHAAKAYKGQAAPIFMTSQIQADLLQAAAKQVPPLAPAESAVATDLLLSGGQPNLGRPATGCCQAGMQLGPTLQDCAAFVIMPSPPCGSQTSLVLSQAAAKAGVRPHGVCIVPVLEKTPTCR